MSGTWPDEDMSGKLGQAVNKINLFKCKNCNTYSCNAGATVTFSASVKIENSGTIRLNSEDGYYDDIVDSCSEITCYECGESQIEIIETEICPHDWRAYKDERRCRLCNIVQRGKTVFEGSE